MMPDDAKVEVTLDRQIKCAGREYGMRRNTYPKWVAAGRMRHEEATDELAAMGAIYATLKALKAEREAPK